MIELGANPHSILGAHKADGGVVVRAYRPEALAVRVGAEVDCHRASAAWCMSRSIPATGIPTQSGRFATGETMFPP